MENTDILEIYLLKMMEFCEVYDAFSIPAAMMAGGAEIKLQDIYTHLSFVEREKYESGKSVFSDRSITRNGMKNIIDENGNNSALFSMVDSKMETADIDRIFAEIDAQIAELARNSAYTQKGRTDELLQKIVREDSNIEGQTYGIEKEIERPQKEELNWNWFLSAPGGGKTTLLKMYSLAYAYKYYVELYGHNEELFGDGGTIENICDQLGVTEGACPFFISVRELKEENYPGISEADGFKEVILDAIKSLVEDEVAEFDVEDFFSSIKKSIYIIDSVEEFNNINFRIAFLSGLDAFTCGSKCYLSSRYREYMDSVKETKLVRDGVELSAKEFVIDGLIPRSELTSDFEERKDIVREFAEKWYAALNKISGRKKLDVDKDFLIPLYKNANVKNLISNPLELTSLLMISSYDTCLPSDFVKIYGRSIELWLSWNNYARYNYEDVMRQLSQVAYQMAISENEKIVVRPNTLSKYIKQSRNDLKRYYQQEWSDDERSINEFIQFLCRSHLVSRSTEGFDFVHRQYQAYLVAYCITTNNFSRETRKKSRFDYVEEHIREKDDFWNQIIIIIVMLDIELRDDIITSLFDLSEIKGDSSITDTNYFVSLLIQLAIMPGVNFDEYELEKLFGLIVQDESRWRLFSSKKADLQKLFDLNEEYVNELFIKVAIRRNNELSEIDKDKFRDEIATVLFYCIWYCEVGEQCIKDALNTFFANFINTNIMEILYNSRKLTEKQFIVKDIACSIGKEAIEAGSYSDCYMVIAAIVGYEGDRIPYSSVDYLISKKTFESDVIAINILVIATWLIRCNKALRYGYDIESGALAKYSEFILKGLLDDKHKKIRRDYLATFEDVFSIGEAMNHIGLWFHEDVFEHILRIALTEYEKDGTLFDEKDGSFSRCFEHISLYPCEYADFCKRILNELNGNSHAIIEKLKDIYNRTEDIMNKVRAAKLLILMSDMQYDDRTLLVKELEKQGRDIKIKHKLKNDDLDNAYFQSIAQIKEYVPEGRSLLANLDLSNFEISLEPEEEHKETTIDKFLSEQISSSQDVKEEYVDYYAQGRYEDAKIQYIKNFKMLSCRNNLAYMLRRGEITSVQYGGIDYSVEELLQEGIVAKEPYSLINYALFISWKNGRYNYNAGLTFLRQYKDSGHLLEAASWWYKLKREGELEGYVVSMWLCDLDLSLFETKEELKKQVELRFFALVKY